MVIPQVLDIVVLKPFGYSHPSIKKDVAQHISTFDLELIISGFTKRSNPTLFPYPCHDFIMVFIMFPELFLVLVSRTTVLTFAYNSVHCYGSFILKLEVSHEVIVVVLAFLISEVVLTLVVSWPNSSFIVAPVFRTV